MIALLYGMLLMIGLSACQSTGQKSGAGDAAAITEPVVVAFADVAAESGIDFVHHNGAYGKKYFPEMVGAGGGWLDYDGDGWPDLLLVQGKNWPSHPGPDPTLKLYRNLQDGRFADVTTAAGLDVSVYGMGMAAADYDNDGDTDLLITCLGPNKFFRNEGGRFREIAGEIGLADPAWSTSAMFFDYDKDGWLDLYVCNYVKWSEETDIWCSLDGKTKGYCTPEVYPGEPSKLYRNLGNGRFADVTRSSGVYSEEGKSLGVALLDFNNDGWPDFAVANDTQPDFLYENNGPGPDGQVTFSEKGLVSGFALDESGKARAGMGIDVGVVDDSGEETIFVGNFSNEMVGVYRDLGSGSYVDRAAISQIGYPSLLYLTFAVLLFDYDLDGDLDLLAVNGHVQPEVETVQQAVTFRQPTLLFANMGEGKFREISKAIGEPLVRPIVGRGAACADYDRDGDADILITVNNGAPLLLRNGLDPGKSGKNNYLRVKLIGTKSNRDGIGARVVARVGGKGLQRWVKTGSTYLSQSELTLTFGTGSHTVVEELSVHWPGGETTTLTHLSTGREITIREGAGPEAARR